MARARLEAVGNGATAVSEREVEVVEGRARLLLPEGDRSTRGPGSKEASPVFYNPAMRLNRDVASLAFAARAQDGWTVLDGLAASGVRGLRYALECGRPAQLEANDWNPVAAKLLARNAERNQVDAHVTTKSLNVLLHESVWHAVEIDPFGSPAAFLDAATRAVRDRGLLGVTATDATALAGVYPNVCRRRYLATPLHGELGHEVALRILAAACVRQAAKHDVALTPLVAHATDHYYRVTLAARRGAARADEAMRSIGVQLLCPTCGERGFADAELCPACGAPVRSAGPVWTGPLQDAATLDAMLARADAGHPLADEATLPLVRTLRAEADAPARFFDLHEAGSRARVGSPPTEAFVEALRNSGYTVGPVHFNGLAVRTDAPAKVVDALARELAR
jgi:tRNA (guanine26-N2/guanine27-N2)-dimethyltransferase